MAILVKTPMKLQGIIKNKNKKKIWFLVIVILSSYILHPCNIQLEFNLERHFSLNYLDEIDTSDKLLLNINGI